MCLEAADDVVLCPLFSLAAYLFWRFDVDGDSIPNFLDRSEWYTAAVFTGATAGSRYTESAQYGSVRALHKRAGIAGKVVHGARVSASQEDARNRCVGATAFFLAGTLYVDTQREGESDFSSS